MKKSLYYIGVIGSRGDIFQDKLFYTKELYDRLVSITRDYIQSLGYSNDEICLISGGCSFCDHIVITLFNEERKANRPFHSLILYLPCEWDSINRRFKETPLNYSGEQLNRLHSKFSDRINRNTLYEIDELRKESYFNSNITVNDTSTSYISRNKKIASKSKDLLIAFGWKNSIDDITNGGTKNTWNYASSSSKIRKYISILTPLIE